MKTFTEFLNENNNPLEEKEDLKFKNVYLKLTVDHGSYEFEEITKQEADNIEEYSDEERFECAGDAETIYYKLIDALGMLEGEPEYDVFKDAMDEFMDEYVI